MKNEIVIFGAFLLMIGLVSAGNIQTSYQVFGENVIVEHNFDEISNLQLRIPYDAKAIELNSPTKSIQEFPDYKLITVNYAKNLTIKYVTGSMVDVSGNKYYFVAKNFLKIKNQDIKLYLEEGYFLVEDGLLSPSATDVDSDGRRILITWNNFNAEQIAVAYEKPSDNNWIVYLAVFVLLGFGLGFYFFMKRKFKKEVQKIKSELVVKKTNEEKKEELKQGLTKNLFEDEKKIIEYLLTKKDNECWTKEILHDLDISKVKLSRKLRSLEQKELIKRLPYGNENRIRLIKK
jgi:uncharacterized membrane protein